MTAQKRERKFFLKKEVWPEVLFFGLICLHGGYFYYESILFGLIGAGLWGIALWRCQKEKNQDKLFDGRGLLLPFLYLLSYAVPLLGSSRMHLYGIYKMLAPLGLALGLLLFWQLLPLLKQALRAYLWSILAAFCLYAAQLVSAGLGWPAADFLPVMAIKGRFTGFLQYANVNAILSLLAGFYAVYAGEKRIFILLAGLSLGLSGSRTAWLLAVILWLAALAEQVLAAGKKAVPEQTPQEDKGKGRENKNKDKDCSVKAKDEAKDKDKDSPFSQFGQFIRKKEITGGLIFMAALLAGGWLMTAAAGGRLGDGLQASELQTRLLYYKDGLAIFLKNPWGYGAYGYYLIQRQFQTGSTYLVKYIHNFLLQILLDGGAISGLLFGFLLLKTLYFLFWGKDFAAAKRQDRQIGALFLVLLGHAFWDFDLEFSYVFLLLWLIYFYAAPAMPLMQILPTTPTTSVLTPITPAVSAKSPIPTTSIRPAASTPPLKPITPSTAIGSFWLKKRRCAFAFFIALLTGGGLFLGILSWLTYEGRYDLPAGLGFPDAAIGILQDSDRPPADRWRAAEKMEQTAVKNVETFAFLRDYYYNKGEWESALAYGRQAVELAPLWIAHRQELMRIAYAYALTHPADLSAVAEDIAGVPEVLNRLRQERSTRLNVKHRPQWEMTEEMELWYRHFQELYRAWKEKL